MASDPRGLPQLPIRHPAQIWTAFIAAAIALLAVTYRQTTPDFWQHLLVGKAIWQLGRIPTKHLWTWPLYGTPGVLPSWGFRWLIWPFWSVGGELGLALWRWLVTLAVFGTCWAAARQMGARGLAPLVAIGIAALSYRARAEVRPETLVWLLLALEIWVLERRRERGGGAFALVAISWVWANVHLSYFIGLALIAFHLFNASRVERNVGSRGPLLDRLDRLPLAWVLALSIAIAFVNPFGWRALWQPFQYFLVWRTEAIYRHISELAPYYLAWPATMRSGLPILVVLWPSLAIGRAFARRLDRAEVLTCVFLTGLTLFNQRFRGILIVAMTPYLARDLSDLAGMLRWPRAMLRPAARAALATAIIVIASVPSWTDPRFAFGIGEVATLYPFAACDFIARHELRGRMFNPFHFGGYVLWRFWPERDRLPFMDIHQSGTAHDRDLAARCMASPEAWNELLAERQFDLALLDGHQEWIPNDRLMDRLDRDADWALVFRDDAAALYLRRSGALAAAAASLAYRIVPGGDEATASLGNVIASDTLARRELRSELERQAIESPFNSRAQSLLANLDFMSGDRVSARRRLIWALAVEPRLEGAHRRLGYLCMAESSWREAIAEFERERVLGGAPLDEYQRMGEAWEKLGNRDRAARCYRRELDVHPANDEARGALERLNRVGTP